ncbi:magnesium-translocating P-type ATPase [Streptomyces sp. SID10853]|uniref:magnesium-translocating P-type ATPase n=1 Tax=Streptomyces sp. SID10853 TaxID=2706028 RepID=UPI0013C1FAB0|nr:magnesium-translocating P-type ATPase [Streptomyces sp. SID10853]
MGQAPEAAAAPEPGPRVSVRAVRAADDAHPAGGAAPDLGELTSLQVLRALDSGPRGLTDAVADARLRQFGENTLPARRPVPWLVRFLRSVRDPFTAVLLCLGVVSSLVAAWGTASVIIALVVVSCVLRSVGEHRADRSMGALRELVASTATVLRRPADDAVPVTREVPVDQLVPGDVVRLGPGDLVPADVRLLRAVGLSVNQAVLTGESAAVAKSAADVPVPASGDTGFDRAHLCFQGSSVASGSGSAVVVATGALTRFAAGHGAAGPRGPSAFDRSVHGISWILIRFMLLTPPLVLMANAALRGRGLETLPFAVAVAVGLTPEMLPVIVTSCLARGASLLARHHGVIVKRLPALHDLGAVDVLCLDKTGTLTQDLPVVDRALGADGADDRDVLHWAAVNAWWTLQLADLPAPDPLDEALLGASDGEEFLPYEGIAALPFDPVRRMATAVVRGPGRLGVDTLVVKGAVENVLERCALDGAERERLLAAAGEHVRGGTRLLAVATAERPARKRAYTTADERGLSFRGFVTLRDALVPSAADALPALAAMGVTVKVVTGDHPGTAARACQELGLDPGTVLTAGDVDALTDGQLASAARETAVFARCTPEHKARIVRALRADGRVCGFLGDGVNDLPALYAADVGICPRDAVDVAREGADVVLAEHAKDLSAVEHALRAGRHSSGNIATYLRITLSSNLGNVIAMLAAGLLLPFLPMLPAQVLVQNLCFDGAQLAFAYDRPAPGVLSRPATLRSRDFLRFITGFGALNAVADLATFGVLALAVHGPGGPDSETVFHSGWFVENLLTQALVMLLLRRGDGTSPVRWAAAALAAVGLLLPLSPLGPPLGMAPLPGLYYPLLLVVLGLYAVGLAAARRRYDRRRCHGRPRDGQRCDGQRCDSLRAQES